MVSVIASISESICNLNNSINKLLKKQWARVLFSAFIAAIPFVLIFLTYPVAFRGNDDYSIAATLQGNFTGEPQFYHRYVSVFLTAPISLLYRLAPAVSWYPICLQIIIYLSTTVILWSFITIALRNNAFVGFPVFAFGIVSLAISSISIAQLDFTRTTVFPAIAAIAVLMTVDFKDRRKTCIKLIMCGVMMLASATIRYSGARPLILLFLAVIFCKMFWLFIYDKTNFKKNLLSVIIVVLCFVSLSYSFNLISNNIIRAQEDSENTALISMVTHYRDYPHVEYEEDPELYDSIEWSESYTNLVNKWCFLDGKVNEETMTVLSEANHYESEISFDKVISNMKEYYKTPYLTTRYVFLISMFLSLAIVISIIFKVAFCKVRFTEFISEFFIIGGSWISSAVMLLYLFYKGRYKEHALLVVCAPLLIICLCVLIKVAFTPSKRKPHLVNRMSVLSYAIFYVVIVVMFLYTAKNYAYNATVTIYNDEYVKGPVEQEINTHLSLVELANENPNNFYMCDSNLYMSMLAAYQDTHLDNHNLTIWGDSTYATYASRKTFELNGIDYLTSDSLLRDNVYILARDECDSNLLNYMKETYGDEVEAVNTYSDPNGYFNIYHFELAQ